MLSRSSLRRQAERAFRAQWQARVARRGLASPASGSFSYETGTAAGIKYAARDMPGPTAQLALVAQAGTRFEPAPGLTLGLQSFAFKGTERRSALRIQRESELLGAEPSAYHSRENLVLGARFLRRDLPYYLELMAEIVSQTRYEPHVYHEEVQPLITLLHKNFLGDVKMMASNSAHSLAFHRGLGVPLFPASATATYKYLDADSIAQFAATAYAKSNFAITVNGAESSEVQKWLNEFFGDISLQSAAPISRSQTKYYGGEERIAHGSGNAMVLGFPGSTSYTGASYKPEFSVLAALLGGHSTIKWSPGFSLLANVQTKHHGVSIATKSETYSDAGLLTVTLTGGAHQVGQAAGEVVKALQSVASGVDKETLQKAKAIAKFMELEFGQNISAGLELTGAGLVHGNKAYQIDEVAKKYDGVTESAIKQAAKSCLEAKACVSSVGDLHVLPYAEDIGLKV